MTTTAEGIAWVAIDRLVHVQPLEGLGELRQAAAGRRRHGQVRGSSAAPPAGAGAGASA